MIFNRHSIRQKLEAIILVTAATVLLLSFFLFMMIEISSARDEAETRLRALATVLGANSSAAITFHDKVAATEVLSTLYTQTDVLEARIKSRNGETLSKYSSASNSAPDKKNIPIWDYLLDDVKIQQPIIIHDEVIGTFYINGNMSLAHNILLKQTFLGLGIFIFSMIVAMLISKKLQHIISDPIKNLLSTITTVATNKDLSQRAKQFSDDELGTLVNEFNSMLDQLQDYDNKLTSYRLDLEKLVIERTHKLEKATEEAKAADQAKSDFLATMSHEIRTPMNAAIGFAGLLKQTPLNEIQAEYVHNISSSTDNLLTIINDILDFSKIEAGKFHLEKIDFILKNEIDDIYALFAPKVEEKDLEFLIEISQNIPDALHGDITRLRQILINLLANAIKFTERGKIILRIELADNSHANATDLPLKISVTDTGIGITDEQQAELFQPFQQGDTSITRHYGGTGLGLIITQRLVAMMNGSINITSTLGEGSCFTAIIYIQAAKAPQQAKSRASKFKETAESPQPKIDLLNLSVLVVDDNLLNLKVATTFLSNEGANVTAVENGKEALHKASQQVFDLILMDLEMPDMSGIETAMNIRKIKEYAKDIPIIALTAHAFPDIQKQVLDAGMNDFLTKPYKPEELFSKIEKWCNTSTQKSDNPTPQNTNKKLHNIKTYNHEAALASVAGDKKIADELLSDFLQLLPSNESAINNAIQNNNNTKLYEAIHKLAGSACIVGAESLHEKSLDFMNTMKSQSTSDDTIKAKANAALLEITKFRDIFNI